MSYDSKSGGHFCAVCGRGMNSGAELTDMRKAGELYPLRICSQGRCWDTAAERDYAPSGLPRAAGEQPD